MPASVSAPQWEFNSLVGFESMSKGKNRQTHAVTQIQKLREIQGRINLGFCLRSIPTLKRSIQRHCHGFSLENLLLCRRGSSRRGCAVSSNIFHPRSPVLTVGYLLAEADNIK